MFTFARVLPVGTVDDARKLLKEASAEQRWNETVCSIQISDNEQRRQERAELARHKRVFALAAKLGVKAEFQSDPRGWPLSLKTSDGRKISVPGRGLPARCFR